MNNSTESQDRTPTSPPGAAWAVYQPSTDRPWNLRRVVHLHRRAGFAATWDEIQRDLRDGPVPSIDRLLAGKMAGPQTPADFEQISKILADAAVAAHDPARLRAWWFYRMLFGPDPLGERLTLMWHNHFATSNLKVADLPAMRVQNELFRAKARAPLGELLTATIRDPAMLIWLDGAANRKEHPNENLSRELMEVFTVGLGAFTEADVRHAARALTGWTLEDDAFQNVAAQHDDGEKTILGRTGRWSGDDLLAILLAHPGTSRCLAWRLCHEFMGEGAVDTVAIDSLASGLRAHKLDIGWGVETILRSDAFFADQNIGTRIPAPAEIVAASVHLLQMFDPPPSTLVLADWTTRLGQDLFYPPNVFGWAGGRAWITTGSVIGRANFAASLTGGSGVGRPQPFDALGLAHRHGRARDIDDVIAFYSELILGSPPSTEFRKRLHAVLGASGPQAETARRAVTLILSAPEALLA